MVQRLVVIVIALIVALNPLTVLADAPEPFLQNPIRCPDVACLITQFLRVALGLIAVVSTAMFIYGGFRFLTSGGNSEAVQKGKDTLLWSSIGIVVVLASWVLVQYVLRAISRGSA